MDATPTATKDRRTIHRSPRYPGLTLPDAIERVRLIYEHDKRSATRPDVMLKHLNLTPGSGPANRILSALRQYGLVEDRDGGTLRVSDAAFKILALSEASTDRIAAIQEAATKPQIIQDVMTVYPEGLPSDATLGDFLINDKGFNPDSVSFVIRVVRTNLAFVQANQGEYGTAAVDGETDQGAGAGSTQVGLAFANPFQPQQRTRTMDVERHETGPEISTPYTYPLSKDCTGIVRFRGRPTHADVERLIQFLTLSKTAFPDSNESTTDEAGGDK